MKEATQNWITLSEKEFKLAELSLKGDEPIGIIYHLHAAVEKVLKAIYEETKGTPPKIHNLRKLAIECYGSQIKSQEEKLFNMLDKAFIDSRYPKSIKQFENDYNISSCKELIKETKELIKCLKNIPTKN